MARVKHNEKPRKEDHETRGGALHEERLIGIVDGYNYSPKGHIEGLLLRDGDRTIQVNVPLDRWPMAAQAVLIGQDVEIAASPEPRARHCPDVAHPVYELISFTTSGGPELDDNRLVHEGIVNVEGIVARFNYTRHGEPNGVVLQNGDFLHLKPHGMRKLGLRLGQEIAATGRARPTVLGHRVIEAEVVDGVEIE